MTPEEINERVREKVRVLRDERASLMKKVELIDIQLQPLLSCLGEDEPISLPPAPKRTYIRKEKPQPETPQPEAQPPTEGA